LSSRFPRNPLAVAATCAAAVALFAHAFAAAPAKPVPVPAPSPEGRRHAVPAPPGVSPEVNPAYDDSSAAAHSMLLLLRSNYGGIDNWAHLGGVRYYVTYRIPGPDSTTVREWSESHFVWTHDTPRIRIDNGDDSTVVVVTGDSTFVRRSGVWVTSPDVVLPAREQALDEVWLVRVPWNLVDQPLKARIEPAWTQGAPLSLRIEYGAGFDRPAGTRMFLRFDPPDYALGTMHWYDPRTKNWYLMEFSDQGHRYGWTWANRRVLRTSDADGTRGPVVWTALVQDMQLETFLPTVVLAPPGGVPYVSHADSTAAPGSAAAGASAH